MNKWIKYLLPALALLLCQNSPGAPAWIEHASKPGPDSVALGHSRFDQLFQQSKKKYRIPYPFERLISMLETRLDNGKDSAVRQVFVPIGRSLQRDTPAPDYFSFPRQVIALEGEPLTADNEAGQVMEYRLFIAHQPKTQTLEVISYNDAAGRFEFQVVENYAADTAPRVRAANRVMCMSCHHNAGPVFPGIPWSETNFNVEVASKLVATLPDQFSSLISVVTLDAGVIDVLAERANYLSATQAIWKQGCDAPSCRAAMLRAALQYRLSGESNFDWTAASYQRDYIDAFSLNWQLNWPQGLALSGSRLPDRNPFKPKSSTASHDPLLTRPAQATWHRVDSVLANGIIYRLAGFFTAADIERIDRHLIAAARSATSSTARYEAACRTESATGDRYLLSCGNNADAGSLQVKIEVELIQDKIESLRFLSFRFPFDSNLLQPDIVELAQSPGRLEAILGSDRARLSLRLANGDRVESMRIYWNQSLITDKSRLEIDVASEFEIIDQAISKLLDDHLAGSASSLAHGVFRRKPVLQELMQALSMPPLVWLETGRNAAAVTTASDAGLDGDLALLEPYCAHCHGDDTAHPPGFLAHRPAVNRVQQCAPRILQRLTAWQAKERFSPAPMPPPASVKFSGVSPDDWPLSDHYTTLLSGVRKMIVQHYGKQLLSNWQNTEYERLPPCLARATE